jgi:hypothetical protein
LEIRGKAVRIEGRLIRIAALDAEGYQFLDDPEVGIKALRESRTRVDLFTFIQKLSDTAPKYKYPMEWDNMAVLPITTFDDWMKNQIDFKVRNKIRKAEKRGVVVREVPFGESLIKGISAIYNESPIRQGRRFWHYGEDLETLRRTKAAFLERSTFIGAFYEDQLIGFIKLTTNEDGTQAGLINIVSMIQHRDKAPTNALLTHAVRCCAERGIPRLWYANFSYGNKQEDSLAEFKRHNGFQKIAVPRYYVPLTVVGRMAFRLGLHHGAANWIPESVAAAYRKVRKQWNERKTSGQESAERKVVPESSPRS